MVLTGSISLLVPGAWAGVQVGLCVLCTGGCGTLGGPVRVHRGEIDVRDDFRWEVCYLKQFVLGDGPVSCPQT